MNKSNITLEETIKAMNESSITFDGMVKILAEYDPIKVYEEMLKTNESFRRFIEENKHKSTLDMIYDYDLKGLTY